MIPQVVRMADEIRELMNKKDKIENEIREYLDVLQSQKGVGMDGPLVDEEQFPRADIDVRAVRQARHRVICLQNDHKDIMKQIETKLYDLHAQSSSTAESPMEVNGEHDAVNYVAFAHVDHVDSGSPASSAGLQVGDEVIQFGSVSGANFVNMQSIAVVVEHSRGKSLPVLVRRDGLLKRLAVTPNTWSGRGLLGCHIVPVSK